MTEESSFTYRWVILIIFMLVNISGQLLWISYAPVTLESVAYYNVNEFQILLMSTSFMIVYIPTSFVASWLINRYGFRVVVGLGAIINGVFGFLRFTAGSNYQLALFFQIIIAIGQPILFNSVTLLSAIWFPESERTTATGFSLNSSLLGIALGMILTPIIVIMFDISMMLLAYGLFSLIVGILFVFLIKERPITDPLIKKHREAIPLIKELKLLFSNKLFWILIIMFLVNLGLFNMVTTYIELIIAPRGLSSFDAGVLGGVMLFGGILGTLLLAPLSDKLHKRKPFIIISSLIAFLGISGMSFANNVVLFNIFGFLLGFGLLSAGPIILEYAAEITNPVPETSSNGFLMVVGSFSGILFIIGFERFTTPTGDYLPALILLSILSLISFILTFIIKDVKKE
ncbi:MAG: MFS transporter [Promethearchaeota archaeon]